MRMRKGVSQEKSHSVGKFDNSCRKLDAVNEEYQVFRITH